MRSVCLGAREKGWCSRAAGPPEFRRQITTWETKDIEGGRKKKKNSNPNKSTAGVKLRLELPSGCQNNLLFRILQEMLFGGICNYCQYLCHLRVFLYITGVCMYIFVFLPYARAVQGAVAAGVAEIFAFNQM